MSQLKIVLISFILLGFLGCKEKPEEASFTAISDGISTFYFIRHAEKDRSDSENSDPELTQAGLGRAMHWAEILKDVPLNTVYSTDYRRTSMTASPIAIKQDIDVEYYDPRIIDIEAFKRTNQNKTVLVVGHSNTTPEMVNLMLGEEKYLPMDDTDNGSLFVVQSVNGTLSSQRFHFSCNCPSRE